MINHILLNEEEKKRILNLHKNEISKYRSPKIVNEQGAADRYIDNVARQSVSNSNTQAAQTETTEYYTDVDDVINALNGAYCIMGTNENLALDTFKKIDPNKFDSIITTLLSSRLCDQEGLVAVMNDEYGVGNNNDLIEIQKVFKSNNSGYKISWNVGGLRGQKVSNITIEGNPNPDKPSDDTQNTEDGSQNTGGSQAATAREQRRQQLTNTTNTIRQNLGLQSGGGVDQEFINKAYAEIYKR
jgi:hypothetical protein